MLQKTKVVRPQVKDPSLLEEHTDRLGGKGHVSQTLYIWKTGFVHFIFRQCFCPR